MPGQTTPPPHPVIPKERNPLTHAKHRRETFWQITLPFILCVLLIVGLAVFTIVMGIVQSQVRTTWSDIAIIWLILPGLGLVLLVAVFLAVVAYGVGQLLGILPGYARQVQNFFYLVQTRCKRVADQVVEPVIKISEAVGAMQSLWKKNQPEPKDR